MIDIAIRDNQLILNINGDIHINKKKMDKLSTMLDSNNFKELILNLDAIGNFDIAFVVFIGHYLTKIRAKNKHINVIATTDHAKSFLGFLEDVKIHRESIPTKHYSIKENIIKIGIKIANIFNIALDFINFVGMLIYWLGMSMIRPKHIRHKAVSYHIYNGVIIAMPIICIVSFIVGGVIAYQGAAALQRMGFPQASVEMTAKLTLREIGPFIVALIVAGRSASAYTAQIGVMKMTEEISAMKTMNFKLMNFIVVPRFLALVVSFPLMVFISDLISIFGCMIFLKAGFNISFVDYISQIREFVDLNSFWTGIIKAPFYAAVIAIVGCFVGFRVEDSTQSIGEKTTTSVVCALFGVILVNALFSLIFTELGF